MHPQRLPPGFLKEGERFTYNKLENAIMSELPFDNSRALLADMDRLGIDKACVLTAFAMRNEMIYEQMQRYADMFIGFCGFVDAARAKWSGEAEFGPQKAAEELSSVSAKSLLTAARPSPVGCKWNATFGGCVASFSEDRLIRGHA